MQHSNEQIVHHGSRTFFNTLEWSPWIRNLPMTALFAPFIGIILFIFAVFGIDVAMLFEGSMTILMGILAIFAIITTSALGLTTFLFSNIEKSLSEFHHGKNNRTVNEIIFVLHKIQKNIRNFRIFQYVLFLALSKHGYQKAVQELQNNLIFLITFCSELRMQLAENMEVQKEVLYSVISESREMELDNAVIGNLILQQKRLSRQITQFEYLQKKILNIRI